MNRTRVMLVDDHAMVRGGVRALLERKPDWEVCGEASTGREAVAAAANLKPDVVVMDISMPDMNGLEATRQILRNNQKTEVLILSMHESDQMVGDVLASGARGYVLKTGSGDELMAALERLRVHKVFFTSNVSEIVLRGYLTGHGEPASGEIRIGQLTPRERELVKLLTEGQSNKQAAHILNITVKTVETHRARIMSKLELHSISDLVRYAVRNNIAVA